MLNLERTEIVLLHPVRVNRDLAKFKVNKDSDNRYNVFLNKAFITDGELITRNVSPNIWNGIPFNIKFDFLRSAWKRKLAEYYIKIRMMIHNNIGLKFDQEEFFKNVKGSVKELEKVDDETLNSFKENLTKFHNAHQKCLVSSLQSQINLVEAENTLIEHNFTKYFDEQDIVEFVKKSEAGITLTEIDYFQYDIPENVVNEMMRAEELKVFDNYYILYMSDKNTLMERVV